MAATDDPDGLPVFGAFGPPWQRQTAGGRGDWPRQHDHCFCKQAWVGSKFHLECCMCGQRTLQRNSLGLPVIR